MKLEKILKDFKELEAARVKFALEDFESKAAIDDQIEDMEMERCSKHESVIYEVGMIKGIRILISYLEDEMEIQKAMSVMGKRSAKAREGETDYSELAKKRWDK